MLAAAKSIMIANAARDEQKSIQFFKTFYVALQCVFIITH